MQQNRTHRLGRRVAAALLTALLALSLWPLPAGAQDTPYFLVVNDNLPESSVYNTPIYVGGITYIPCTVFDSQYTGVSLGVSYQWSRSEEIVSLYTSTIVLDFNLATGTVTDYPGRNEYSYSPAVLRNGLPYVPATAACGFFGLTTSYLYPDSSRVLRIKSGSEVLDDASYLQAARPMLEVWTARFHGQTVSPGVVTPPEEDLPVTEDPGESSSIVLALAVTEGSNVSGMLGALRQRSVKGIFFFRTDDILAHADSIIDIVNQGSRVGLIPTGNNPATQLESVLEGANLLSLLLHQRVFFLLGDGLHEGAAGPLKEAGYLIWSPRVTLRADGRGGSQIYMDALDRLHSLQGRTRLLIYDDVPAGTLSSLLRQLRTEAYALLPPQETDR